MQVENAHAHFVWLPYCQFQDKISDKICCAKKNSNYEYVIWKIAAIYVMETVYTQTFTQNVGTNR